MLDVRVKKRERHTRLDGLHPEADLTQLNSHRIEVDAEDAVTYDLPKRVLVLRC